MKKIASLSSLALILASLAPAGPFLQEEPAAVAVPVRVFSGKGFIGDLRRQDFVLFEDGQTQEVDGLFLIRRTEVEAVDGLQDFHPPTSRNFHLWFLVRSCPPQLEAVIDFLFADALTEEDSVVITTPAETYTLSGVMIRTKPREMLAAEIKRILKADIEAKEDEFQRLKDLASRLVAASYAVRGDPLSAKPSAVMTMENLLQNYRDAYEKWVSPPFLDEKKVLGLVGRAKDSPGQNLAFLFYQEERRAELDYDLMSRLIYLFPTRDRVRDSLEDLNQMFGNVPTFDVDRLSMEFASGGVLFSMITIASPDEQKKDVDMRDVSANVKLVLSTIAVETGGRAVAIEAAEEIAREAVTVLDRYYLLTYRPKNPSPEGDFRRLQVEIRGDGYSIVAPRGYFASLR